MSSTSALVIPGVTRRRLAEEALRRRPGLKLLYITGYTLGAIVHGDQRDDDVDLLPKPFTVDQLAQKVREVLDRR